MLYYSYTAKELAQAGIQEGELAIYTGTGNPLDLGMIDPSEVTSRGTCVYCWEDGTAKKLRSSCFRPDRNGLCTLEAEIGEDRYTFLRNRETGYIRQLSGPARPVVLGNLGSIPLRTDTLLGKFEVPAGTILRLDESAPQRKTYTVRLTFTSSEEWPLESALLREGGMWRPLNICKAPAAPDGGSGFVVRDGCAVVQYLTVHNDIIHMADSPEPNPDYKIFITKKAGFMTDKVTMTLEFDRREYKDGVLLPVRRTLNSRGVFSYFDLAKVQRASTSEELLQSCVQYPEEEIPSPPSLWDGMTLLQEKLAKNFPE